MRPMLEELELRISPDATPINPVQLLAQMQVAASFFQQAEGLILQAFPTNSQNPVILFGGLIATNTLFTQVVNSMQTWLPEIAQIAFTGQAFPPSTSP